MDDMADAISLAIVSAFVLRRDPLQSCVIAQNTGIMLVLMNASISLVFMSGELTSPTNPQSIFSSLRLYAGTAFPSAPERPIASHPRFCKDATNCLLIRPARSEERRVGKECRSRWS